jgi:putative FmdB family regulatory protein
MPIYGYRCSRGHQFEVQQRITEPALTQCRECGAPVTRVFYPVGIIFKGGGFYKTDSRGKADGDGGAVVPAASAGKTDGKPTEKSADKSTETKPKTAAASDTGGSTPPAKTDTKAATQGDQA